MFGWKSESVSLGGIIFHVVAVLMLLLIITSCSVYEWKELLETLVGDLFTTNSNTCVAIIILLSSDSKFTSLFFLLQSSPLVSASNNNRQSTITAMCDDVIRQAHNSMWQ